MMRVVALIVVCFMVVSCGVGTEDEPRVLDIELEADIGPSAIPDGELRVIVEVYLVTDGQLVSVGREVADAEPETILMALLRGPVAAENSLALRSAIPPETDVIGVRVSARTALVDLTSAFTLVGGAEEILAVAQIVATMSSIDGVDGVRFAIEETPRPAPVAEGELVDRPLTPADFSELFTR